LGNAVKFTHEGGSIWVTLTRIGEQARIEVRDTGIGIAPEFLPHVFERFAQADQTTTRGAGGLGLGLAIVHSIVHAHGGTAEAESAGRDRGSTFTLTIPLVPPPSPSAASTAPLQPERRIDGVRLLVVEDDPDTRLILAELLAGAGAQVREAESGPSAMKVLDEFTPDVLVCDIGMPEEDGCTLLRRIRARGPGRVRALALTAYTTEEDRARTEAAGFEKHLAKPVDVEQLIIAVSSLSPDPSATS
jgi:CheY-like chemotaxis protein